jgi:tetratricopeptide (TPR) repeat protein
MLRSLNFFKRAAARTSSCGSFKSLLTRHIMNKRSSNGFNMLFCSIFIGFFSHKMDYLAYCESLEIMQERLQQAIVEGGEESDKAIKLQFDISFWFMNHGMQEESLAALEKYLTLIKKKYGVRSNEYSRALTQVGSVYTFFNNHLKAIATLEEALEVDKLIYGEEHRYIGQAYFNLGALQSMNGQNEKAIKNLEKSVEIYDMVQPGDHLILTSLHSLAHLYKKLGLHEKAYQTFKKLFELNDKKYGANYIPNVNVEISKIMEELKTKF